MIIITILALAITILTGCVILLKTETKKKTELRYDNTRRTALEIMETNKLEWKEDEAKYCAYCNNITLQDLFSDGTKKIWICKTCNTAKNGNQEKNRTQV